MTVAAFLSIAAIHLLAAISPGPSFVVAVRTAAAEGFRPTLGLAAGFGLGAVIWAVAALAGLAVLFELAPALLTAFRIAGAAFLIWLAWTMWHHAAEPMSAAPEGAPPRSLAGAVRLGLATQLANPKPAVFFGAVFVGLVPPDAGIAAMALLIAVIFADETLWYVAVGRVFSAGPARAAYGRLKAAIDRIFGGLMGALGLKMAIG